MYGMKITFFTSISATMDKKMYISGEGDGA